MAVTTVTSGLNQEKGITYSVITDSSADWASVANDTYFYDLGDGLPHHKDGSGTVLEIFAEGVGIQNLDTATKSALTPATGDFVYDTDLDALQRYDGSSWVDIAKGYGVASVNNSSGVPTYYSTLKDAVDNSSSGDVVKLHSDVSISSNGQIDLDNDITIDLNGYTYEYTASNTDRIFLTSNLDPITEINITNGTLKRTNSTQTGDGGAVYFNRIGCNYNIKNVTIESNVSCSYLRGGGTYDLTGSKLIGSSSNEANYVFNGAIIEGGEFENTGTGEGCEAVDSSIFNNSKGISVSSSGISCSGGELNNCKGISTSGIGLTGTSGVVVTKCVGESTSGRGVSFGTNSELYDCIGISSSNVGLRVENCKKVIDCEGYSGSSFGIESDGTAANPTTMIGCTGITNSGTAAVSINFEDKFLNGTAIVETGTGDGILIDEEDCTVAKCYIEVADATSVGILAVNHSAYLVDNDVRGTATNFSLGTGTNLWTATKDSQGNSAKV